MSAPWALVQHSQQSIPVRKRSKPGLRRAEGESCICLSTVPSPTLLTRTVRASELILGSWSVIITCFNCKVLLLVIHFLKMTSGWIFKSIHNSLNYYHAGLGFRAAARRWKAFGLGSRSYEFKFWPRLTKGPPEKSLYVALRWSREIPNFTEASVKLN